MKSQSTIFEPLSVLTARAIALRGPNIDTDQIIPARFLKKDRALGYGQYLFYDARFDEQGELKNHVLNQPDDKRPEILVVEENFGCGSSREGAVYALADYGVRAVIGTTFGDIFHNNCFKNGVLPIRLSAQDHARVMDALATQSTDGVSELTVDLESCEVRWANGQISFEVDAFWRECLLKGLDELSLTLSYQPQIDAFETQYHKSFPWLKTPI
ncbi:3-isopropylmalate dehydratase small subunit [Orrella sp. 11846]|uniref:3-isopropylmalate dehydratase small subunit n=1 Tax=Orrella sp. 11846 TaxID=3409913 RepID=UPI003B5C5A55